MLTFSCSSVLMSVVFSNILLILLCLIFRNSNLMMDIGYKLLGMFIIITVLRFLFPFEVPFSTHINYTGVLSDIIIFIKTPYIDCFGFYFSIWNIFLIVWLIGSSISVIHLFWSYYSFQQKILSVGDDISDEEPYASILEKVCQERHKKNCFHIIRLPDIASPMITGICEPYILIPEDFHLSDEDVYYVLCHETAHFFHHDLILKLLSHLLCVMYWWNPFVVKLKNQIGTMLELRVDLDITHSPDTYNKVNYLECLLRVAKAGINDSPKSAITFCHEDESTLAKRFSFIMNASVHKTNRLRQMVCSVFMIGLYAFSIFFIFEPYSLPDEEGVFQITSDNTYLIDKQDGSYDLYYNDEYMATIHSIDESFPDDLPVYQ